MELTLTPDELDVLRDVLRSAVSDLSPEIADTDNPAYRRTLEHRRDLLRAVVAKLA